MEIFDVYIDSKKGYTLRKDGESKDKKGYLFFTIVPFYYYNGMKKLKFGIRDKNGELIENENLLSIGYDRKEECYYIKLSEPHQNLNIIKPRFNDELDYLKIISQLNLKRYEYKFDYIFSVVQSKYYNDLIDIIMELGINEFTIILIRILNQRNITDYQIADYLENKYKGNENYSKFVPKIIFELNQKKNNERIEKSGKNLEKINKKENLLCDSVIFVNETSEEDCKNIITDTIKNLNLKNEKLPKINKEYCIKKIEKYNKSKEGKKKPLSVVLTVKTIDKIKLISLGILSNISIIIQGFTSAGKSFISTISSIIIKEHYPISTALSENTTVEDLLGRFILKREGSSIISFVPGILLTAFIQGKILILDECDLAKPEVLSCILRSINENEIIVNNNVYRKMKGYNVILTMNGEIEGFTEGQRNILTSNILSKFVIVQFAKMDSAECEKIF